jgi:enoyl-CoA hydratase/carnithine racemase
VAELVEREESGAVVTLWLNRPDRRNALSSALIDALFAGLDGAVARGARVVVLAARGKAFCAGGDLSDGLSGAGFAASHAARGRFAELMDRIPSAPFPVIAAVHGDALGGGCGLVAACDLAIADPAARFGTPEVKLGLFPWIIAAALARSVPRKALLELVLTGEPVDAERAVALGLANRVSAPGASVAEAQALAAVLARRGPWAIAGGKRLLHALGDLSYRAALDTAHQQLALNLLTEDAAEGLSAFLQKRDPEFKGR